MFQGVFPSVNQEEIRWMFSGYFPAGIWEGVNLDCDALLGSPEEGGVCHLERPVPLAVTVRRADALLSNLQES